MTRLLALAALLLAAPLALAQDSLAIGDPVPLAAQSFETVGGGSLSLAAAAGESGLVVVMWSAVCPWTSRYEARMAQLYATATANGIGVVLVASNDPNRVTRTPEVLAATAAAVGAPMILDPTATLADALGATQTPEAFFFDGGLLYSGALDDSPADAERVTIQYLQQALDQHLAAQSVEIQRTTPFGCTIKRAR
ncbi:redoxin domain-containing protein [Rubricoccus marinus]|uniref:Thioredoxin domain-containing protein n=1 Tax=Rubricoccus marinus TaxID=716817 RepID=A0A259TXS3_9BACT|nr:redoxin domain-containing protein [Rubricoccus marinus]OZC02575.1 hypothetical protein BSZ36_06035 [Rubricoccus marinus]